MNETFRNIYGYVPLNDQEMKDFANRYMTVIDPRFVKIVICKSKVVAFLLSMPSLTKGIQRARGRLFPFGFIHILRAVKKTRHLDLMLVGVHPDYRNLGLVGALLFKTLQSAKIAGFNDLESHLILEHNNSVRNIMDHLEATIRKRFRVYQKSLV
jgi:ribosomal protein S18 acetylase RimI-like enzyme